MGTKAPKAPSQAKGKKAPKGAAPKGAKSARPPASRPSNGQVARPGAADTAVVVQAAIFKYFGDTTRLRILRHLEASGQTHVGALCAMLGMSQPSVSHHLALLRHAGLIEPLRVGKNNYYELAAGHPAIAILRATGTAVSLSAFRKAVKAAVKPAGKAAAPVAAETIAGPADEPIEMTSDATDTGMREST